MPTVELTASGETFGVEHIDGLYRYAVVLTGNRADAEDLVQETYARAIEAFHRLREDSNVKGWLLVILRNLWFNELRKRRRRPQLLEINAEYHIADTLPDPEPNALQMLEGKEDMERVRAAMQKLPFPFREILILREFEELSYGDMAAVLGCAAGTVMSRLARARGRLRELLTCKCDRPLQSGKVEPA